MKNIKYYYCTIVLLYCTIGVGFKLLEVSDPKSYKICPILINKIYFRYNKKKSIGYYEKKKKKRS